MRWVWASLLLALGASVIAPLAGRRRSARPVRIGSAILLWAFVVVGLASVGLFYLPAAIAMAVAAARSRIGLVHESL